MSMNFEKDRLNLLAGTVDEDDVDDVRVKMAEEAHKDLGEEAKKLDEYYVGFRNPKPDWYDEHQDEEAEEREEEEEDEDSIWKYAPAPPTGYEYYDSSYVAKDLQKKKALKGLQESCNRLLETFKK